jgi:hypothetical protein
MKLKKFWMTWTEKACLEVGSMILSDYRQLAGHRIVRRNFMRRSPGCLPMPDQRDYSCACTSGNCDESCKSITACMRRSI